MSEMHQEFKTCTKNVPEMHREFINCKENFLNARRMSEIYQEYLKCAKNIENTLILFGFVRCRYIYVRKKFFDFNQSFKHSRYSERISDIFDALQTFSIIFQQIIALKHAKMIFELEKKLILRKPESSFGQN